MGISLKNYYFKNSKRKMQGLTLIEVLIALAIVGIAMTAVIKATTQNIRSTAYLEDKTIAMWVGQEILNEVHAQVLPVEQLTNIHKTKMNMLGKDWYWKLEEKETANKHIMKLEVNVYKHEDDNDEDPIISFEGYHYHDA